MRTQKAFIFHAFRDEDAFEIFSMGIDFENFFHRCVYIRDGKLADEFIQIFPKAGF